MAVSPIVRARISPARLAVPTSTVEAAHDAVALAVAAPKVAIPKSTVEAAHDAVALAVTAPKLAVPTSTVEAAHDAVARVIQQNAQQKSAAIEAAAHASSVDYNSPVSRYPSQASIIPSKPAYQEPARAGVTAPSRYTLPADAAPAAPEREVYSGGPAYASPAVDSGDSGGGGGGRVAPAYDPTLPADDGYQDQAAYPVAASPVPSTALATVSHSPPVITPSETPGLFTRIWRFFFGAPKVAAAKPANTATVHGDPSNTQEAATVSLVRRARAGDQNAMATLNLIRENATKGEPKAVSMYRLLCSYVRQNPASMHGESGSQSPDVDPAYAAAVRLSHGEVLSNSRIQDYAATMSGDEEKAFVAGMYQRPVFGSDPGLQRANFMGRTIGMARRLQEVRHPLSSISNYDAACAWELGE